MNEYLFIYSWVFFIIVLITAVYFKRKRGISYDRKALLSVSIALIFICIGHFVFEIDYANITTLDIPLRIYASATLILSVNAVVQFVFWIAFALVRYQGWIKMPRFLFNIFSFFIILGVLLYVLKTVFNQPLTGLLVTSTVVSAIIGLALQETLSNLFSGISLQIESPFNMDDWVNLGGFEGKVVSQNWRTVTILTRENHRVSLTNRFVAEDKIVNYSRPTRRQIHNFYIELDYNHPPNQVKEVLRNLLNEIDEVELDENHGAFVVDYMESGIKYCLRYWLYDYADILLIQDTVLSRLWYTLRRNEIKIPYPTSEVQMQMLPNQAQSSEELKEKTLPKFLANLDWLSRMDDKNIEKLSKECQVRLYARNDLIVKQGEEGSSMFIILKGGIKVLIKTDSNRAIKVAEKSTGEFFGEMSLLTGEPRTASIRAMDDCEVLVIDKESFSTLIISDKKILAEFVEVLVECKSGLADAIEKERSTSNITKESAHTIILNKIKNYFKLAA